MTEGLISSRRAICLPSTTQETGIPNAFIDGDWVVLPFATGYDYVANQIAKDAGEQTSQALKNILAALESIGACLNDIIKVICNIPDIDDFQQVKEILCQYFKKAMPAARFIIKAMPKPEMKIQMEVIARLPSTMKKTA